MGRDQAIYCSFLAEYTSYFSLLWDKLLSHTVLVIHSVTRISGTPEECLRARGERYKARKTGESFSNVDRAGKC